MLGRGVCGAALSVWLVAVWGLRGATRDVASSGVVLPNGTPGVLYAPDEPASAPRPVALLFHDYAGNAGQLGYLSRQIARAGWAALAIDLQGHGRNPAPFEHDGANRALARETRAAIEWVHSRAAELDPARVALIGHGMGARAALQQAQWNPSEVAALVLLAPAGDASGPYPPPSTSILWGNWDLPGVRAAGRAIGARLADRVQITGEVTYGDPSQGGAVRIAELTGPGHWSILWSDQTAAHVLDWLAAVAPDPDAAGGSPRVAPERTLGWAILGWIAALVLIWELPRRLRTLWLPELVSTSARAGPRAAGVCVALLAAAALIAALPPSALGAPLPLAGAREPLVLFALSGAAALALAPDAWRGIALRRAGTWLGGAALAAALYVLVGPLLTPWLDPWPATHRLGAIALAAAAALPHFAALEWLLRVPGAAGAVLPAATHLLGLALLGGGSLAGFLPEGSQTAAHLLLLGLPVLELLALRCAQIAPNPWTAALARSLWAGWVLGTLFPLGG